ncbi:protease PrsW [Leptospira ognonensis]|uniref:Protease PrsW n=1 Tax=Leptospira ognonensis TaxID=2484945 RepID=A0A4R9JU18_9LEPT|nr:PrsW family glutamic-type intramembrane protease [Leptospira ognonensis]TGL56279.1 protease PrsW [Leptospira ognonensis]
MTTFGLLALAILPGFVIVQRYYSKDHLQKEPISVVLRSFYWGAALILPAGLFETLFVLSETPSYIDLAIHYFLVVGITEEVAKYLAIRFYSARNDAFNEHFDGIVYGACVGGGFATFENIFYVLEHGFAVGVLRAFLSVPGHILWGAIIGHWIAKEKMEKEDRIKVFFIGVGISSLLHGGFDFVLNFGASALMYAPIFVITPLLLVRHYSKSALEKDKTFLFGTGNVLLPTVSTNDTIPPPNTTVLKLVRAVLVLLAGIFFFFALFLFPFCIDDFIKGAEDFEAWMFSIPTFSLLLSFGMYFYSKRFRVT